MIISISVVTLLAFLVILLFNYKKFENKFEKILLMNFFTNIAILIICLLSLFPKNESYIDIAYIYVLIGYVAMIAYMKFYVDVSNKEK